MKQYHRARATWMRFERLGTAINPNDRRRTLKVLLLGAYGPGLQGPPPPCLHNIFQVTLAVQQTRRTSCKQDTTCKKTRASQHFAGRSPNYLSCLKETFQPPSREAQQDPILL